MAAKLVRTALEQPIEVGAALLASAEGYTPRATKLIDEAREQLGAVQDVALALSENLPAPKAQPNRNRRRRRRKKKTGGESAAATPEQQHGATPDGEPAAASDEAPKPKRRRRRKKPAIASDVATTEATSVEPAEAVEAPLAVRPVLRADTAEG